MLLPLVVVVTLVLSIVMLFAFGVTGDVVVGIGVVAVCGGGNVVGGVGCGGCEVGMTIRSAGGARCVVAAGCDVGGVVACVGSGVVVVCVVHSVDVGSVSITVVIVVGVVVGVVRLLLLRMMLRVLVVSLLMLTVLPVCLVLLLPLLCVCMMNCVLLVLVTMMTIAFVRLMVLVFSVYPLVCCGRRCRGY